jgi:hypothetical protein
LKEWGCLGKGEHGEGVNESRTQQSRTGGGYSKRKKDSAVLSFLLDNRAKGKGKKTTRRGQQGDRRKRKEAKTGRGQDNTLVPLFK